jgi:hypothetical protein
VSQLKVPLRQFKEIATDATDVVMMQVGSEGATGTEVFCAYPQRVDGQEEEGVEIPAAAMELTFSAVLIRTYGLSVGNPLAAQVVAATGEGVPCLLWGDLKGVDAVLEKLKEKSAYSEMTKINLYRRLAGDTWTTEYMILLGNSKKPKVCSFIMRAKARMRVSTLMRALARTVHIPNSFCSSGPASVRHHRLQYCPDPSD